MVNELVFLKNILLKSIKPVSCSIELEAYPFISKFLRIPFISLTYEAKILSNSMLLAILE